MHVVAYGSNEKVFPVVRPLANRWCAAVLRLLRLGRILLARTRIFKIPNHVIMQLPAVGLNRVRNQGYRVASQLVNLNNPQLHPFADRETAMRRMTQGAVESAPTVVTVCPPGAMTLPNNYICAGELRKREG